MNEELPKAEAIALWEKTAKNGKVFMSGVVEVNGQKYDVVLFQNDNKRDEKQPDWSFRQKPQDPSKEQ